MENNDSLSVHLLKYEVHLAEKNDVEAIEELNEIVACLKKKNTSNNASDKKVLILYVMKRINFNFKYGKYTDVVDDCTLLGQLGKDINKDKDLFLMNEQSLWQILMNQSSKRFEQAKIQFNNDEDIALILGKIHLFDVSFSFSRIHGKPPVKKQKVS